MKKTIVTVALVLIFVLALAAPAFAQTMTHSGVVKANGMIWSNKTVGHACNTGLVQNKTIRGNGELTNDFNITMVKGKTTVVDNNDFVSQAGTTAPLTITSVITLCTPAKYTYKSALGRVEPVGIGTIYNPNGKDMPAYWDGEKFVGTTVGWEANKTDQKWTALSSQTWAAQVRADAGFSGKLNQNFEAAYGPFYAGAIAADLAFPPSRANGWTWRASTGPGLVVPALGARFVGDYFRMSQTARTSMGKVNRYIDLSSPWSGALLYEDSEFTGFSETVETFNMTNLTAGADVPGKWWTGLFTKR